MTITSGGITTTNSVNFSTPIYIGGPQSWSVASGQTMTVTGPLHTIISNLTFSGAGTTTISGLIDGGGVINLQGGAKPGGLIQAGTGPVTITGTSAYAGDITANAGAGTLYIAPSSGGAVNYSGGFFGGGTVSFNIANVALGGGASNFTGKLLFQKACPVTFEPAAGIVGTFSCVVGNTGSITQGGSGGTTVLTGHNTYTGSTTIGQGALQADIGVGIPSTSFLNLTGGVLQSNSAVTFTRSLGTSGSTFEWSSGGGFAAGGGAMTVNIGNGAALTWGTSAGSQIVGTLDLNSPSAAAVTTFQNKVALNGATRTIFVDDNPNSTADYAVMSGVISGSAGITKTGSGLLSLTASNTYTGTTTISGGSMQATVGTGIPTNGLLALDGGILQTTATTFTRALGSSGGTFELTANGGGFAAAGTALTVNAGGAGGTLTWGSTLGSNLMGPLTFGTPTAVNNVTLQNGLNLGGGSQTINVNCNNLYLPSAMGGAGSLTLAGTGTVTMSGATGNTYAGATTFYGQNLTLSKTSGYAIPGDLILASTATNPWEHYVTLAGTGQQIAPTSNVSWTNTATERRV